MTAAQIDKNERIKFPDRPKLPIIVCDRYDNFFRDKLRRAISEDLERYTEKKPTYYNYLIRCVEMYASDVVYVKKLSDKNFYNFLSGMNSEASNIAVMDAYIQIAQPGKRESFSMEGYIDNFCNVLSEYFEQKSLKDYEREKVIQQILGIYSFVNTWSKDRKNPLDVSRYFVIVRSKSNRYLLCYDFEDAVEVDGNASRDKNYFLKVGVIFPRTDEYFFVMRDIRYRLPSVGIIRTYDQSERVRDRPNKKNHIAISLLAADYSDILLTLESRYQDIDLNGMLKSHCCKVTEKMIVRRVEGIVEYFQGAF